MSWHRQAELRSPLCPVQTGSDGQQCAPASRRQAGSTALTAFCTQVLEQGSLCSSLTPIVILNKHALTLMTISQPNKDFIFLKPQCHSTAAILNFSFSAGTDATREQPGFQKRLSRGAQRLQKLDHPIRAKRLTAGIDFGKHWPKCFSNILGIKQPTSAETPRL